MPLAGRLETTPLVEVLQIVSYSQRSGSLHVRGDGASGVVVFDRGGVVCAASPEGLPLLVRAAKESVAEARLSLTRIAVLVALRELLDVTRGEFHFERHDGRAAGVEGLDLGSFYDSGALDTGDLLLVLERAADGGGAWEVRPAPVVRDGPASAPRNHDRAPVTIPAILHFAGRSAGGYLTNLSEGGTFLTADEFPEPDCLCRLEFELPWELGRCEVDVKVAWLRPGGPEAAPGAGKGAGLSFLALPPDSKRRIASYLERFRALAADLDCEARASERNG